MTTVFSALGGLLFEPQCERIAPNVFSKTSWLRLLVSRNLNLQCPGWVHYQQCFASPVFHVLNGTG